MTAGIAAEVPRLLFIIGTARSGSTILDATLGSLRGIVATGELYYLLDPDLGNIRNCACGLPVRECEFWAPVLERWGELMEPEEVSAYQVLQRRYERMRRFPRLMWDASHATPEFEQYGRWTRHLLRAIGEVSGASLVADSSKHPPRAAALVRTSGVDLGFLHVVRDPRAVAWSKVKFFPRQWNAAWLHNPLGIALRTSLDWVLINRVAERIPGWREGVGYVRVRYEDFASRPAQELERMGALLDFDPQDLGRRLAAGEPVGFGHVMAGNRARHGGPRPLRPDLDWEMDSPVWMRRLVWALTSGLARRYGYSA